MSHSERQTGELRYTHMLASSATAAVCAGADNLICSWNSAAEELFGHSAAQAVGQPLSLIIPERLRASHDAGLKRAVQSGQARLSGHSVEILALHANGTEIPIDLSLSMWFEAGEPMFGALIRDIADRHSAKKRLEHLAHCDTLTSLPNRNALQERMAADIGQTPCSLLLLDLDGFKYVNDSLGHSLGDRLLNAVAARLSAAAMPTEFVSRLGGDEFAVLVPNCEDPLLLDKLASRIRKVFQTPFELDGQSIYVGTSIGIAVSPKDATDADHLLSCADMALYSGKSDGGGVRKFFSREMQYDAERRHRLGLELRQAFDEDQFEIWYQPQVSLSDNLLVGFEALLRWRHPERELLLPLAFLEVLERSAIAEEVGDWILDQACKAAADWNRSGFGQLRVGVNLFPTQLRSGRLFDVVSSALKRHALSPCQLELEITENTLLRHNTASTGALRRLRDLGVGISFDDFGTGFASLSLLQEYPVSRLKIDRTFIAKIDRSSKDAAIVKAVIGMAESLGLEIIAEGVETAEQEATLLRLGCHEVQGYRYGRPLPLAKVMKVNRDGIAAGWPRAASSGC